MAGHDSFPGLQALRCPRVGGNWRVTFRFTEGDAEIVNYEDYH